MKNGMFAVVCRTTAVANKYGFFAEIGQPVSHFTRDSASIICEKHNTARQQQARTRRRRRIDQSNQCAVHLEVLVFLNNGALDLMPVAPLRRGSHQRLRAVRSGSLCWLRVCPSGSERILKI